MKKENIYFSPGRRYIIEELARMGTAEGEEIWMALVTQRNVKICLSSVYLNLSFFVKMGFIRKVKQNRRSVFELQLDKILE